MWQMAQLLSFVALQCVAFAAAEVAMPPNASTPLAMGLVEGFISDSCTDVATCGNDFVTDFDTFKQAVEHLEGALKSMNLTEVEAAIHEFSDGVRAIPRDRAACKPLKADLKALVVALKKIHGPKDVILHILDNLVGDGEKIFDKLAAADKAYKTAGDYMTAGQNLGMAFRRMLLGELNATEPPTPPIPGCKDAIAEGLATGFVSDSPLFVNCSKMLKHNAVELKQAKKDLAEGISSRNLTEVEGAVHEIFAIIREGREEIPTCKASLKTTEMDIKIIVDGLKKIHGPKDLLHHLMANLLDDGVKIFDELGAAADSHKNKQCMDAGRHMGMAFRRVLVGEASPSATVLIV